MVTRKSVLTSRFITPLPKERGTVRRRRFPLSNSILLPGKRNVNGLRGRIQKSVMVAIKFPISKYLALIDSALPQHATDRDYLACGGEFPHLGSLTRYWGLSDANPQRNCRFDWQYTAHPPQTRIRADGLYHTREGRIHESRPVREGSSGTSDHS